MTADQLCEATVPGHIEESGAPAAVVISGLPDPGCENPGGSMVALHVGAGLIARFHESTHFLASEPREDGDA
jgi:hypothetical protein